MIIGVDVGALSIADDRLKVGVYRVTYNLLRELAKIDKKNEYRLYTFLPIDKEVMKMFGVRMKNIIVRPTIGWSKIQLPIELRRHPVDIFIGLSQMIPYSSARNIGIIYDLDFLRYPDAYPGSLKRLESQTKYLVDHSEKIVTISQASKRDIITHYGIPKQVRDDKVVVAYPGIDARFTTTGKKHKGKNPYVLFVGALKRGKNVPYAIQAFKKFLERSPKKYDFLLVGGNYWKDPGIQKTITDLSLNDRVRSTGFVPDDELPSYYRGAEALFVTSVSEGFCLPAIEALRCGSPVVYANAGALPEVIGASGIAFDLDKKDEAAKSLIKIATNPSFRKKLVAAGIKRSQQFTWSRFARSIYGIISSE